MDRKDSSKIPSFSPEQVKQLLSTPEAQQLIALLNRDGGKGLQQAAEEFRKGNVNEAQEVLKPLMKDPEADALLKKIQGK